MRRLGLQVCRVWGRDFVGLPRLAEVERSPAPGRQQLAALSSFSGLFFLFFFDLSDR